MHPPNKSSTISSQVRDSHGLEWARPLTPDDRAQLLQAFQMGGIAEAELWIDSRIEQELEAHFGKDDARTYMNLADICRHYHANTTPFDSIFYYASTIHANPKRTASQ